MPPVPPGRRGSRATQRPGPSARPPDLQATPSRPSRHARDPQARREQAVSHGGEGGGPRHNTTADLARQCTPMSDATEALQARGGKRRPVPRSVAAGSTPCPEEAGPTSNAAPQVPPLQRGEAADIRRPSTPSSLGQLRPGQRI
ncbi:hypothetical protein NDU88_001733 [Pleurodeles waltl]|uniref:Uncharacterized protein n=1 Tax=Pleurodeles waltl TaxID=8319 RepID=A0AAV7W0V0_PLEWA|nr:hypothetical protein NDU88_001733 [Pleurodeles waltl]